MRKPIIGILGNTYKTQPGLFSSAERMYVNSDYIESVLNNGGIPMAIPAVAMKADPEGILAVCDGILVPGGEDLNPWYYGEEPKPQIRRSVRRSTRPGLHLDGQQKRWECLCLASAKEFSF